MYYSTKGEFLESIGKDRKDVRLVDRMIIRGEVLHDERGYSLTKEAYKEAYEGELNRFKKEKAELNRRIEELEEKLREKSGGVTMQEVEDCALDLRDHLIYAWKRLDHVNSCIDGMVQSYFNKNRQSMDFDSAQEKLYSIIKYVPDPGEKEERQFAIDNGLDLE